MPRSIRLLPRIPQVLSNYLKWGSYFAEISTFATLGPYKLAREGRLGQQIAGVWFFTRAEIDAYKAGPKNKGGRPKHEAGTLTIASPA